MSDIPTPAAPPTTSGGGVSGAVGSSPLVTGGGVTGAAGAGFNAGAVQTTLTDGWYVGGAVLIAILVSGTQVAPIAFGLLAVATIFQLNHLLSGK